MIRIESTVNAEIYPIHQRGTHHVARDEVATASPRMMVSNELGKPILLWGADDSIR